MNNRRAMAISMLAAGIGVLGFAAPSPASAVTLAPVWDNSPHAVLSSSHRLRYVVSNPNSCAPFQATPVWAPGPPRAAPLGYRCYNNPNGG